MTTLAVPAAAVLEEPLPAEATAARVRAPRPVLAVAGRAFLALAALLLGFAAYVTVGSRLQFDRTQDTLYATLRDELHREVAPISEPIAPGSPLALLEIPELSARLVVVEGSTSPDLTRGIGHRSDTVLPGQAGLSVLLGRKAAFGGPFGRLATLRVGDTFTVTTGQGTFTYVVDTVTRSGAATRLPAAASRLSLVTADRSWSGGRSLVVSAVLRGQAVTAVTPPQATEAERPSHGDPDAAFPLALWSLALAGVACAAAWSTGRVAPVLLWVGTAPVLLAIVWNVYESVAGLLPNTL